MLKSSVTICGNLVLAFSLKAPAHEITYSKVRWLSFISFQVLILLFHFFPSSKENQADVKAFVRISIKQTKTIFGDQVLSAVNWYGKINVVSGGLEKLPGSV
jgi:hypothetical protein